MLYLLAATTSPVRQIEPGTIVNGSARLQLLRGQAPESTKHSPAIVQHLSLAEALDGLGVRCTPHAVPTVATRVLNGQVVSDPPVTAACTKYPNMESIAKRPFLIPFTFSSAAISGLSAKLRGSIHSMSPRCLLAVLAPFLGGWRRRGWGGGVLAVRLLA